MRPEAIAAMVPFLAGTSATRPGSHARGSARPRPRSRRPARRVAAVLGAAPDEVVFTGGGTEADNLAVKGAARAARAMPAAGDGVVTTAFEHKGVLARRATGSSARASACAASAVDAAGWSTSTSSRRRSTPAPRSCR